MMPPVVINAGWVRLRWRHVRRRIVRNGKPILTVPSNWRDNAERWI